MQAEGSTTSSSRQMRTAAADPSARSSNQNSTRSSNQPPAQRTSGGTPHSAQSTGRGEQLGSTNSQPTPKSGEEGRHPYEEAHSSDAEFDDIEQRARAALESIAMKDADVEFHMPAYVAVLKEYRAACQQRTMYKEAHLVQHVLRNLRLEEETRHVRGLTEQQMMERRMLEDANREEFRQFHYAWNIKIDEFEEAQLELELQLLERQNEELIRFHDEMRNRAPIQHYSRKLIDVRNQQQTLAGQRQYVAAHQVKRTGDTIELADMGKQEEGMMLLHARREHTLRHRHQQELNALRTKVESRRLFLERNRKRELDELLQRYINARRGMETQQNIVRGKTGQYLLKHACNAKSDLSGTTAVVESAYSGTFGAVIQRRYEEERRAATVMSSTTPRSPRGEQPPPPEREEELGEGDDNDDHNALYESRPSDAEEGQQVPS